MQDDTLEIQATHCITEYTKKNEGWNKIKIEKMTMIYGSPYNVFRDAFTVQQNHNSPNILIKKLAKIHSWSLNFSSWAILVPKV